MRVIEYLRVSTRKRIYVGLLRGSGQAAASRLGAFLDSARAARTAGKVIDLQSASGK